GCQPQLPRPAPDPSCSRGQSFGRQGGSTPPQKGTLMTQTLEDIRLLARQLRVDAIRCSTAAGSGHPTSSLSAADLMAVLMARHLRYDWDRPDLPTNDHLVFSKGHAS